MAPNKFNYLYLTTTLLLLVGPTQIPRTEARFAGVNPFCRTSNYRRICTRMVNGASTQTDASVNAMQSALDLARRVRALVPLLRPAVAGLSPATQESILATCAEDFEGIADDLAVSIEALAANDVGTARSHLSGALRSDCKDAMKEFGAEFPLNKFARHLSLQVDNCLAVLMQN
ncbi:plant invertase/pectin methylesterase inhibitor [Striga asiatica]|uniref:Plant invertase/pectin methylesterase inhibitor n=1 Tax=Striga asiatica TaxID=4170 RepID=A0A5A7R289_STRAF|nr:plant invertase/pectin methylesterase inhibitor [Striga asiatica]